MKRSFRWYFAWGIMVASLSMLLFMATAGPALAWTQLANNFDTGGDPVCSGTGTNGTNSSIPCHYWREPNFTSITLIFQMDPSLRSSQSGNYDFPTAIQNAFTQYNGVSAWNPYMSECFTFCQGSVGTYYMTVLPCGVFGQTVPTVGITEHGYNPERGGTEYYAFFSFVDVGFSNSVHWNNSEDWSGDCSSGLHGDGRTVATHESGHAIGLGHTRDQPAIMNFTVAQLEQIYQLTTNSDIAAIKAIYPGNQESN